MDFYAFGQDSISCNITIIQFHCEIYEYRDITSIMSPNDKNLDFNTSKRKTTEDDEEFTRKKIKSVDVANDDTKDNGFDDDNGFSPDLPHSIPQPNASKDDRADDIELIETIDIITSPPQTQNALTKDCYVSLKKLHFPPNLEAETEGCHLCGQLLKDVSICVPKEHSVNSVSSVNPTIPQHTPTYSISDLSIFDSAGHLVPYDAGLIEKGRHLFVSGIVTMEGKLDSVTIKRVGPIWSWRRTPWLVSESNPCLVSSKLILTIRKGQAEREYEVASPRHMSKEYRQAVRKFNPVVKIDELDNSNDEFKEKQKLSTCSDYNSVKGKKLQTQKDFTSCDNDTPFIIKQKQLAGNIEPTDPSTTISELLQSLGGYVGMGEALNHLLPGCPESSDSIAAFLLFVNERQQIWKRKQRGEKILTENKVMSEKWFTNMYRELDRGTIFFRNMILSSFPNGIPSNSSSVNEDLIKLILFYSLSYRLVNKMETFIAYGKLPDRKDWGIFSRFLRDRFRNNKIIFTAAHQNMGLEKYLKTMSFVAKESNINALSRKLRIAAENRNLKDCNQVLLSINNVGPFFAWQVLCDLLECNLLGKCTDNQWTSLGPGAKSGLRRIFDLESKNHELHFTRLLRNLCAAKGDGSGFEAIGVNFPVFLDKELSMKNVEHALCEFDKYYRFALGMPARDRTFTEDSSRVRLDKSVKCSECKMKTGKNEKYVCVLCKRQFHFECYPNKMNYVERDEMWFCEPCTETINQWRHQDTAFQEIYSDKDKNSKLKKVPNIQMKVKEEKKETNTIIEVNLSDEDTSSGDEDSSSEDEGVEEYGEESDDDHEILCLETNSKILDDSTDVYDLDSFAEL